MASSTATGFAHRAGPVSKRAVRRSLTRSQGMWSAARRWRRDRRLFLQETERQAQAARLSNLTVAQIKEVLGLLHLERSGDKVGALSLCAALRVAGGWVQRRQP